VPHLLRHGTSVFPVSSKVDRSIQSPLTTHKRMWRIYSIPDPHGFPFSRLLRHTRGCGESILSRILTDSHSVASYDTQGDAEDLFYPGSSLVSIQSPLTAHKGMQRTFSIPDPHRFPFSRLLLHTRGCGGPILTRILTDPHSVASCDTQEDARDLF
jgi:hypothetical protein